METDKEIHPKDPTEYVRKVRL